MKRRFDDGLQRERRIYHYGFLPCGRQRVCAGRPFDSAPAIRYLEMHRQDGLLLGPLFQRPVFRPKGFGGAGAGRSTVPGRTAAERHCAGGPALFPMGERTGVRNALPRRLFRFHPRTWRHYGAPGTGGKGIPKRSTELRIYRRRVSLF